MWPYNGGAPPSFNGFGNHLLDPHEQFSRWSEWEARFGPVLPTQAWRQQVTSHRRTPYEHPAYHNLPYGGRPAVPHDLSGPNANTMRGPTVPLSTNHPTASAHDYYSITPPIDLHVLVSSIKLEISWTPLQMGGRDNIYELTVISRGSPPCTLKLSPVQRKYSMRVHAGEWYDIELVMRQTTSGSIMAKGSRRVKAVFSYEELRMLYDKAVSFTGHKTHPFQLLYRCKPKPYWDDIHHNFGGVMEKYMKDDNGQPGNVINGVLSGLFFSARLAPNGELPHSSPFGNVRMLVQAYLLLDMETVNIYFADFYCNYTSHYVTIVVAVKNSDTDHYARSRLIQLDFMNNPFLRCEYIPDPYVPGGSKIIFHAAHSVWVEVLYTENIRIDLGRFDNISATGRGTSRIGGLKNNRECAQCNLYPVPLKGKARAKKPATAADVPPKEMEQRNDGDYDWTDERYYDQVEHNGVENGHVKRDIESPDFEPLGDEPVASPFETGSNSTFHMLINTPNTNDYPCWTDLIECVCEVIDSVCEQEQEDMIREQDPLVASQLRIDDALKTMHEGLKSCKNEELLSLSRSIEDVVDLFKMQRAEIFRLFEKRECAARMNASLVMTEGRRRVTDADATRSSDVPATPVSRKRPATDVKEAEEGRDEYLEDEAANDSAIDLRHDLNDTVDKTTVSDIVLEEYDCVTVSPPPIDHPNVASEVTVVVPISVLEPSVSEEITVVPPCKSEEIAVAVPAPIEQPVVVDEVTVAIPPPIEEPIVAEGIVEPVLASVQQDTVAEEVTVAVSPIEEHTVAEEATVANPVPIEQRTTVAVAIDGECNDESITVSATQSITADSAYDPSMVKDEVISIGSVDEEALLMLDENDDILSLSIDSLSQEQEDALLN